MLARTLAATGLALALAFAVAAPGQAEVVCDTESIEDGTCDPGAAARVADGGGASAVSADDLPVDAIRQIIREYLIEHPEVLIEAERALQAKRAAREADQAREAIHLYRDELFSDPEAPVAGNPDGAITLVEFFDYRCGYCRRVKPTVETLLAENDDLRLVFKEFPILGPESTMAAYAALAARSQGSYEAFHWALMETDGSFDRDHIFSVARSVGLDTKQLARDMEDPALDGLIEKNAALASTLGISGTPAFVVGERLIGGALPLEHFRIAIADARQALAEGSGTSSE